MNIKIFAAAALACMSWSSSGLAQKFPDRPIRLVVPLPAGGGVDTSIRIIADKLSRNIGQNIVIENRPGAGGLVGAQSVVKASPDGYTLLVSLGSIYSVLPVVQELPLNPFEDFEPISFLTVWPTVLVVPQNSRIKSVLDIVSLSKQERDGLVYGTQGAGSSTHINVAKWQSMTGANLRALPYRGEAMIAPDLLPGRIDFSFLSYATARPFLENGSLRALAIAASERWAALSDIPTMSEAGFPDIDYMSWTALVAPKETSKSVVGVLHAGLHSAASDPSLQKRMEEIGMIFSVSTPQELKSRMNSDAQKWRPIVRSLNLAPAP